MATERKIPAAVDSLARFILAGGGVVCLLALAYFAYHYGWTGERQFSNWAGVALYYMLPAAAAVALFSGARMKPAYRLNTALILASFAMCVYLGEIGLTVSKSLRKDPAVKPGFTQAQAQELGQRFGVNIDMRDGLEVVDDLRKKGINAVPVVLPGDDLLHNNKQPDGSTKSFINIHGAELMPLGNIAGTVTVMCNEGGSWITYETDEHGFNNPKGIWPAGFDIAAVGDSHAQGYCVPADKNFVALLRNQGSTIVNLGMGGNGPLLELASLTEYVQPSKPKVVLWFYSEGTDLYDLQLEKKSKLLMNYLQDGFTQNLIQRQDDIDKAIADEIPKQMERRRKDFSSGSVAHFLHGMKDSHVPVKQQPSRGPRVLDTLMATVKLSSLRERLGLVYGTDTAEVERLADLEGTNVDLFRDVLAHVHASVQAWGGALYFVYVPSWKYYIPEHIRRKTFALTLE